MVSTLAGPDDARGGNEIRLSTARRFGDANLQVWTGKAHTLIWHSMAMAFWQWCSKYVRHEESNDNTRTSSRFILRSAGHHSLNSSKANCLRTLNEF